MLPLLFGIALIVIFGAFLLSLRRNAQQAMRIEGRAGPVPGLYRGCMPLLLGMGLIVVVLGCVLPSTLGMRQRLAFAEAHPPVSQLIPALVDKTVMIEGVISPQTPLVRGGFVAFDRYTRGNKRSRLDERYTPPFRVALPGQVAQLENPVQPAGASYRFDNPARHPDSRELFGLWPGDRVLAFGTVRAAGRSLYLDADTIYRGGYASYLADQRGFLAQNGPAAAALVAGAGVMLIIYALFSSGGAVTLPNR